MAIPTAQDQSVTPSTCWCCGRTFESSELLHLGEHPEVAICLSCAHFLHQRARAREDAEERSVAARARDVMRSAREFVIRNDLHNKPLLGPVLRWLGPRLP